MSFCVSKALVEVYQTDDKFTSVITLLTAKCSLQLSPQRAPQCGGQRVTMQAHTPLGQHLPGPSTSEMS
jgi:hypothetical protein